MAEQYVQFPSFQEGPVERKCNILTSPTEKRSRAGEDSAEDCHMLLPGEPPLRSLRSHHGGQRGPLNLIYPQLTHCNDWRGWWPERGPWITARAEGYGKPAGFARKVPERERKDSGQCPQHPAHRAKRTREGGLSGGARMGSISQKWIGQRNER